MAAKEERPSLLSKMAKFVRNPTKDWSEIGRPEAEQESGYDKQALKAMIERKRQNDFVRKREFDQLRKLRNRDPAAVTALARTSVFQSSISTDMDGRAHTLKKIDEIEAQMSKQWWKGRQDATPTSSTVNEAEPPQVTVHAPAQDDSVAPEDTSSLPLSASVNADQYATTASHLSRGSNVPSRSLDDSELVTREVPGETMAGLRQDSVGYGAGEVVFSTSKLFAVEVDEMATDPELEEAAIRFANGDDAGAEQSLLQALAGATVSPEIAAAWAAALLDLYRATANRTQFDRAVLDYAAFWGATAPTWLNLSEVSEGGATSSAPLTASPASTLGALPALDADAIWNCPEQLTAEAMEELRHALATHPLPWNLGWARLRQISPEAMPLLGGLFSSLCNEPVALRFSGADKLVRALRAITPSGNRQVDSGWWLIRLNALRTMLLLDEFELVALDYCVTYEVSPPAWEPARCSYESVSGGRSGGAASDTDFSQTVPLSSPMALEAGFPNRLELRGEVLGDAAHALASIDDTRVVGDNILVSCKALVRVDFSAAGSILNWVAMRQSEGSIVQFRDVHRLVAAFFNVIGINEHARVVPRRM